jgi:hypothetical protein
MTPSSGGEGRVSEAAALRGQRDCAVASAWLALAIALAVLISNFRDHAPADQRLRETIAAHQAILASDLLIYSANQQALRQVEAALDEAQKSANRRQR